MYMNKRTNTVLRARKVQDDTNDQSVVSRTEDDTVQEMNRNTELVILRGTNWDRETTNAYRTRRRGI